MSPDKDNDLRMASAKSGGDNPVTPYVGMPQRHTPTAKSSDAALKNLFLIEDEINYTRICTFLCFLYFYLFFQYSLLFSL